MTLLNGIRIWVYITLIVLTTISCGGGSSDTIKKDEEPDTDFKVTDPSALTAPTAERDWIQSTHLFTSEYPHASPIHNGYFLPVGEYSAALHKFTGRLKVESRFLFGDFNAEHITGDESFKQFPDVDLTFVSDNGYLIPINRVRQLSSTDNSFWGIILDPGRVWSEVSDDGWSRASFPFSLISARRNQVHNGVATFLYNENEVSKLRMQVTQETTLWFKKDIYAQLDISYEKRTLDNEAVILASFEEELDKSVNISDWSMVNSNDVSSFTSRFNSALSNRHISSAGIITADSVFLQPCYTRYGDYPYCRWMRNGAYSVTKSLGASLVMMRLAQLYGENIYELKVSDYLSIESTHEGWQGVTFSHLLNMASGIGNLGGIRNSGDIFADENTAKMENWLVQSSESKKLSLSFTYRNYDWGPGEVFRYNSAMTFVLAAALDSYYRSTAGENQDLWQMMEQDVFNVIGIQHLPILKTDELEGAGIAELFHGLYLNIDDLAKLVRLLQNNGMYEQQQLLSLNRVRESLFKAQNLGVLSWWEDNEYGRSRYLNGFWSSPFGNHQGCLVQIPYMSGYGGNIVALLPNGTSVFRFADAESYSPAAMIAAATESYPVCNQ